MADQTPRNGVSLRDYFERALADHKQQDDARFHDMGAEIGRARKDLMGHIEHRFATHDREHLRQDRLIEKLDATCDTMLAFMQRAEQKFSGLGRWGDWVRTILAGLIVGLIVAYVK